MIPWAFCFTSRDLRNEVEVVGEIQLGSGGDGRGEPGEGEMHFDFDMYRKRDREVWRGARFQRFRRGAETQNRMHRMVCQVSTIFLDKIINSDTRQKEKGPRRGLQYSPSRIPVCNARHLSRQRGLWALARACQGTGLRSPGEKTGDKRKVTVQLTAHLREPSLISSNGQGL